MAKPVVFTIDDDIEVLRAVERDLRRGYGLEYRVMRADSGSMALEALEQLKRRGEHSALFLVDQRMPGMNGVEFIAKAKELFPDAKRVLLTAYADTEAAIKAINDVQIDHYLLKPWDPPEEKLYPVLSDLLDDWQTAFRPAFEDVRVVGNSWNPAAYNIKDFLARNNVPYSWMDPDVNEDARQLVQITGPDLILPAVFLEDGTHLSDPDMIQLADSVGLRTTANRPLYDLVVVGGGPAGLAAAVYGASEGLKTIVLERSAPGGQAGMSSRIENYLGFPSGLSGSELARRAVTQARRFGVEILTAQEVVDLSVDGPTKTVRLGDGSEIASHSLLIATGVSYRNLNAP
jgi:thioredoxin reductase (NADPH)